MNPHASHDSKPDSRARSWILTALLLLAGLTVAATPVEAAQFIPPCNSGSAQQKVNCLLDMVGQQPGCISDGSQSTCLQVGCEGTASVGTASYWEDEWGGYYTGGTCYYSTSSCALERWTEYDYGYREYECMADAPSGVVGSCPSGETGVVVNGRQVCVDASGPYVTSCDGNEFGLVVLGTEACRALPTVGLCPSGSYGVKIDGSGCHTVSSCDAGEYGTKVDGSSLTCVDDPVGTCPNGRTGVVIAGQEICPVP